MQIRRDDLDSTELGELLREHLSEMAVHSPPESVHALDLESLRAPSVTMWTLWEEGDLLGCGALRELEDGCGEIKSMRTARRNLRRGVAARLLEHLVGEARRRGYRASRDRWRTSRRPGRCIGASASAPASRSATTCRTPTACS